MSSKNSKSDALDAQMPCEMQREDSGCLNQAAVAAFVGLVSVAGLAAPSVAEVKDAALKLSSLRDAVANRETTTRHSLLQDAITRVQDKQIRPEPHTNTHTDSHTDSHTNTFTLA